MRFQATLDKFYPHAIPAIDFVRNTQTALSVYGFTRENTLACVGLCRDEIVITLAEEIRMAWGKIFTFSSLGGMLLLGKTGFLAAHNHAPVENGRERYIYFAMPHIAIDRDGEIGRCYRPGRPKPSEACGALMAFQKEMQNGPLNLHLAPNDIEQSLLKQRLSQQIANGMIPDLVELTRIAHDVILEDLEHMIAITADPTVSDYAVFSGIQIHAPEEKHYVWPGAMYVVKNGQRDEITPLGKKTK